MKNKNKEEIFSILREYKNNLISKDQAIDFISKIYKNKFNEKSFILGIFIGQLLIFLIALYNY